MFKAPNFWNTRDSKWVKALLPISKLYGAVSSFKVNKVSPEKAAIPVVCIGNVVLGGAGKTPTVDLVCEIFHKYNLTPHILTGGYGGYLKNVIRVDPAHHSYLQVGDEALLSAEVAPTWVGRNRINSAKAATLAGADVLVMDDGFQNNSIFKDFKILVVDSGQSFGNEFLFPAGPLRESVEGGIKKSDIVLIIGEKNEYIENRVKAVNKDIPLFYAKIQPQDNINIAPKSKVIGFCGIGYPAKFKKTLKELEVDLLDFIAFSDHHPYTITEIQKLIKSAQRTGARLVTTRKDFIKIPEVFRGQLTVIDIKLSFTGESFEAIMLEKLALQPKQ